VVEHAKPQAPARAKSTPEEDANVAAALLALETADTTKNNSAVISAYQRAKADSVASVAARQLALDEQYNIDVAAWEAVQREMEAKKRQAEEDKKRAESDKRRRRTSGTKPRPTGDTETDNEEETNWWVDV
jgi:hypothetical protein